MLKEFIFIDGRGEISVQKILVEIMIFPKFMTVSCRGGSDKLLLARY